jgi:hypothetical protein
MVIETRDQETCDLEGREIIENRYMIRDKNSEDRTKLILD